MKTKLLKIINHYGINNQILMLVEEYGELLKELCKMQRKNIDIEATKKKVEEEMTDVCVLLMQFANYYKLDIPNMSNIAWYKVDRQLGEIENE